ncbi:MAG: tetratricopeptide repeat protein [Kangiellaceae bacterium]|nr:tetratricopeptide repeat protein [Kangiellaceae bacterium]
MFFVCAFNVDALPSTKYTRSCSLLAPTEGQYDNSKVPSITSEPAFKKLSKANQFYADEQYSQAIPILNDIIANSGDRAAKARSMLILGRIYQAQNKFSAAASELKKALDSGDMGQQNEAAIKQSLAFLYSGQENHRESLKWMKEYFNGVINPPASSYAMLAQSYYRVNDFKNAICPAYLALKQGYKSKKNLYGFLLNAHVKIKDLPGAEVIAKEMVELFPKEKSVLNNLFGIYSQQGKQAEMLALAELAYLNGMWSSETNYKQLSSLYVNRGVPLLAAERLKEGVDKGIVKATEDNWKNIAINYQAAKEREKAILAYEQASKYTNSGKYLYKIGNMYFDKENYSEAIKKFRDAINKGGLNDNDKGYAYLWTGVSQFREGNPQTALATLKTAQGFSNVSKNAGQFINYINVLEQQKKAMQEAQLASSEIE